MVPTSMKAEPSGALEAQVETTVVLRVKRKNTLLVEMAEARMQEMEDKVTTNVEAEAAAEPSVLAVELQVTGNPILLEAVAAA